MTDTTIDTGTERPVPIEDVAATSVAAFRARFKCTDDPALAERLVREEIAEVKDALAHLLKELCDLVYVIHNAHQTGRSDEMDKSVFWEAGKLLDKYGDLMCDNDVALEAFRRVHASNMLKELADGTQKIRKGENYVEPELLDLI